MIKYNNPVYTNNSTGRYNGNIAEVDWRIGGTENLERYSYSYDKLSRLTSAIYSNLSATILEKHLNDEILEYDLNENILHLSRNAKSYISNSAELIDELTYQYNSPAAARIPSYGIFIIITFDKLPYCISLHKTYRNMVKNSF